MMYVQFSGDNGDPYRDSVILLINEHEEGATSFVDTSQYTNPVFVTGNPIAQDGYIEFDGVDDKLSINVDAVDTEWHVGTDDLTVEALADFDSLPALWTIITNRARNLFEVDAGLIIIGNSTGAMQAVVWAPPVSGSPVVAVNITAAAATVTTGKHHILLQRSGTTWTLAFDGATVGSATSAAAMGNGYDVQIADDQSAAGRHFDGGLKVRVTRGVARYASFPFTPPTYFPAN